MIQKKNPASLTEGSIVRGLLGFAVPLFLGQLLQQLYNMADAWVVGNFAENDAFAAVSMASHISFLIIGFFNGIAIGGGVVICRYFGAKNERETCCGSFDENKDGAFQNVFKTPENRLEIDCEAVKCVYNENHHCTAKNIDISGDGASRSEHTQCATFQMK